MPSGHFATWRMLSALGASAAIAGASLANPIPEDQRWATVTHAGNAPHYPDPNSTFPIVVGAVDHEYQISRTETTIAEWFEFVQAYAPYVSAQHATRQEFTSQYIGRRSNGQGGFEYYTVPQYANRPAEIGWRFAARYCNWLHNGKATNREAFENGAYDTSTFSGLPGNYFTDQLRHHPDATYWIPTHDEWVKAVYFDPNRYGTGLPGYWPYPYSSESPPIPGFETSAGTNANTPAAYAAPDIALFPNAQTPWGLLDASGGLIEWLEDSQTFGDETQPRTRRIKGSPVGNGPASIAFEDHIETYNAIYPSFAYAAIRVARSVPAPGAVVPLALVLIHTKRRRSRCNVEACSCRSCSPSST